MEERAQLDLTVRFQVIVHDDDVRGSQRRLMDGFIRRFC